MPGMIWYFCNFWIRWSWLWCFCIGFSWKLFKSLVYMYYSNPFASMIFGPREKSCYSKIMLWKSATKNFYSVIISHYTRENFYSMIISHYTREKCNHKKFQCYISLLMYIHTDKIFVQYIQLQIKLTNY